VWDITECSRIQAHGCEASEIMQLLQMKQTLGYCFTVLMELLIKFNSSLLNNCVAIKIHHE
jgi:hypothetical protein